jgi:hypothetical protein
LDDDESDGKDESEDNGDDDSEEKPAKKKQRVKEVGSTDKGIKIVSAPPKTKKQELCDLFVETLESKDKLFIISHPRDDYQLDSWHVVQVSMDDTDNDTA